MIDAVDVSAAVASVTAGMTVACPSVTVATTVSVGVEVISLGLEATGVCVSSDVGATGVVTVIDVADAGGVCVASAAVAVATLADTDCSAVCVLGAALVTPPVAIRDSLVVNPMDAVSGVISVTAPVTVGALTWVIALPARSAGVTISPVETVKEAEAVPDKADGMVKAVAPVKLLLVAVSSAVAAVIVTTAVAVATDVAGVMIAGVLNGSVADSVAAAVSTPEIVSPTLPIAAPATGAVNAWVRVSTGLALKVGAGVASVGKAATAVPVVTLVLRTTVGRFTDDGLERLAAPVNAAVTLTPWAGVIRPTAVAGWTAETATVALRPLVVVNPPVVVTRADVANGAVCVNDVEGPGCAATDMTLPEVITWVAVKLATVPTVADTATVGATVVVKFAAVVVWLRPFVAVRR